MSGVFLLLVGIFVRFVNRRVWVHLAGTTQAIFLIPPGPELTSVFLMRKVRAIDTNCQ